MKSKIVATTLGSFFQMGFSHLGTLLITIALTRILSVSEFGVISLVNTVVFFLIIIVSLGVPSSLARYLAVSRSYEYTVNAIGKSVTLLLPWIIVFTITYLLFFSYMASTIVSLKNFDDFKYIILCLVFLELLRLYVEKISHGTLNMSVAAKMSGYSSLLMLLLMIPAAVHYHTSYSVLWAKSLAIAIPILPMMLLLKEKLKVNLTEEDNRSAPDKVQILKYGFPLSLISIAGFGFLQTDILFIAYYLNSECVAYYSVAMFIFVRLITVPRALGNGLAPVLAESDIEEEKVEFYKQSLLLAMVFSLPIILYTIINGKEFLSLLFGEAYTESYKVFVILSIYFFLGSILAIINPIMDFSGKANVRAKAVIVGAVTNIFLDIILIPEYGMNGAAFATIVGYFVFFVIVMLNIHPSILHSLVRFAAFYRLFLVASLLFLPLMYLHRHYLAESSIVVNAIALLVLYPLSLMYFKVLDLKKIYRHYMKG